MTTFPRRLSVIVSADVVGYNRLMVSDEEGTTAALKKHREVINSIFIEDGGRVVKTTGDGLLLEFPSAFHAVRASLGAQRAMAERNKDVPPDKRLEFRMGMHLGDVVVDNEDASGDGINIAERLQEIADPGGICLSRAAHAAVHKDFNSMFADGGRKALKDIDAPVHVYKLAPEAAMLSHIPAVTVPRQLLSLVVLPFVNASGTTRHDFLADSITDQLTGELARIEDSFVVDRKTALATAGFGDNLAGLGKSLGIRYAVKGSVGASEAGLRIDAALIDAETGVAVWHDHLDIAVGDPFVMQHEVNARLVPLVYSRLLDATGHASSLAPAALPPQPSAAAQPLSVAPVAVREAAPAAEPQVVGLHTAEPPATTAAFPAPTVPQPQAAADVQSQAAALVTRWQVLHRPSSRRPVNLPLAAAVALPPLRIVAQESVFAAPPSNVAALPEIAAPAPLSAGSPVIQVAPGIAPLEPAPAPPAVIRPAAEIAPPSIAASASQEPPLSLLIIEPAPEEAASEPPKIQSLVIRPRTVVASDRGERVVQLRPVAASQPTLRRRIAGVVEMPTPSRTDRPEWRMPLWLRLPLMIVVGALGGAIAFARLGFARETVISIGSWILIAAGLTQLASAIAETLRSARLLRPAGPLWVEPQPIKTPKRVRAKVISVRAVLRSPRGTSRSKQYAP